jgi:protein phosphatase
VIGDRLYTGTVGDSRVYLVRGKTIHQLTTDHTWIQEALEKGLLKPEQARGHPNAHVIRRFVGSPTPPEVDLRLRLTPDEPDEQAVANQGMRLLRGDRLLLCSDGLTDMVSNDEILHGLGNRDLQGGVESLVDLACRRGGHDNITAVVLEAPRRAPFGTPSGAATGLPAGRPALNRALAGVGCFLLILLAVAGGYLLYQLGGLAALVQDLRVLNASVTPGPTAIVSPTAPGGIQYPTLLTPPASLTPLPTTTPSPAPTTRTPTLSNRVTVTPALPDQPNPGPGPVIDATLQPDFSQPGPFGTPGTHGAYP